jgi:hypothetical protein
MNSDQINLTLPDQKNFEQAYGLSLKLAVDKLSGMENLEKLCLKSGSTFQQGGTRQNLRLVFLNKTYQISLPDFEVSQVDCDQPVSLTNKILIFHYLLQAKGNLLSNRWIAFQELKEGALYYPSFVKRSVKPLIDNFGLIPEKLKEVSRELGGLSNALGDISVTIPAFARLPVAYVIWKGDAEFPPNANILFDETVLDYLPVEDVTVLCQTITWRLVNNLKSTGFTSNIKGWEVK